jgi:hypothetical protein
MQSGIIIRIYSKLYAKGYKKTTYKSGFDWLKAVTSPVKRINLISYLDNIVILLIIITITTKNQ